MALLKRMSRNFLLIFTQAVVVNTAVVVLLWFSWSDERLFNNDYLPLIIVGAILATVLTASMIGWFSGKSSWLWVMFGTLSSLIPIIINASTRMHDVDTTSLFIISPDVLTSIPLLGLMLLDVGFCGLAAVIFAMIHEWHRADS